MPQGIAKTLSVVAPRRGLTKESLRAKRQLGIREMRSALLTILLLVAALAVRAAEPAEEVQRMAVRLMGKSLADHIEFRQIEADGDVFELRSDKGKIVISGNSANSMAMGLGHYLRYCCHVNVSWDADEKIAMPKSLPPVDKPMRRRALVEHRFFLNYCTFGYTMVWWQWREWKAHWRQW